MTADAAVDATPVRPPARSLPGGTGPRGHVMGPRFGHLHPEPVAPPGRLCPIAVGAEQLQVADLVLAVVAQRQEADGGKPIVTELALADALDQLVNLIEELRIDVNLRVEIPTDETELVKLTFSGTPDVGFPLQREVRDLPGKVVRRVWNEGLRNYDTPYRSGDAI